MILKRCSRCGLEKPLADFHLQPSGKYGRHSYCKPCANEAQRRSRVRNYTPEQKRRWQVKSRYGMTIEEVERLFESQGGLCAICGRVPSRPCIDHDHLTGAVRGMLCHRCNINLQAVEDRAFLTASLEYLARHSVSK